MLAAPPHSNREGWPGLAGRGGVVGGQKQVAQAGHSSGAPPAAEATGWRPRVVSSLTSAAVDSVAAVVAGWVVSTVSVVVVDVVVEAEIINSDLIYGSMSLSSRLPPSQLVVRI